jgi:hypothetical protein
MKVTATGQCPESASILVRALYRLPDMSYLYGEASEIEEALFPDPPRRDVNCPGSGSATFRGAQIDIRREGLMDEITISTPDWTMVAHQIDGAGEVFQDEERFPYDCGDWRLSITGDAEMFDHWAKLAVDGLKITGSVGI